MARESDGTLSVCGWVGGVLHIHVLRRGKPMNIVQGKRQEIRPVFTGGKLIPTYGWVADKQEILVLESRVCQAACGDRSAPPVPPTQISAPSTATWYPVAANAAHRRHCHEIVHSGGFCEGGDPICACRSVCVSQQGMEKGFFWLLCMLLTQTRTVTAKPLLSVSLKMACVHQNLGGLWCVIQFLFFFPQSVPKPIALEPCFGNKAAVLSIFVRLPRGTGGIPPPGQSGKTQPLNPSLVFFAHFISLCLTVVHFFHILSLIHFPSSVLWSFSHR